MVTGKTPVQDSVVPYGFSAYFNPSVNPFATTSCKALPILIETKGRIDIGISQSMNER